MLGILWVGFAASIGFAEPQIAPKEALKPFNLLVGSWKGTGYPEGTREERQKGFWTENITWAWQFTGQDVCLIATIEKGKYFTRGVLSYLQEKKKFQLALKAVDDSTIKYLGTIVEGKQKEQILTLDRTDDPKQNERLVFTMLHHNRYLYSYLTQPTGVTAFTRKYQVGATKEGEPFAEVAKGPECIVSGGRGTMAVTYKGKTYYVCCSGCRDAFKDEPEKYIAEAEKKAKSGGK